MGEEADEHYNAIMESEMGFYRCRRASRPRDPQCITCGMWCRWHEHPQGWRLTMPDGSVHICGAVASVSEFPEVKPTHDEFGNPIE